MARSTSGSSSAGTPTTGSASKTRPSTAPRRRWPRPWRGTSPPRSSCSTLRTPAVSPTWYRAGGDTAQRGGQARQLGPQGSSPSHPPHRHLPVPVTDVPGVHREAAEEAGEEPRGDGRLPGGATGLRCHLGAGPGPQQDLSRAGQEGAAPGGLQLQQQEHHR